MPTVPMNDVFERSFAGKAQSVGKRGEVIDPRDAQAMRLPRAVGREPQTQDLEEATRFMVTRGMGDEGRHRCDA